MIVRVVATSYRAARIEAERKAADRSLVLSCVWRLKGSSSRAYTFRAGGGGA